MKNRVWRALAVTFAGAAVLAACGGSSTDAADGGLDATVPDSALPDVLQPVDAGRDQAAPVDAASDSPAVQDGQVPDGGQCVSGPKEGAACAPTDLPCARVDLCCSGGFKWKCDAGKWNKFPSGILCLLCPVTPCGTTPCPGNQFCVERTGGGGSTFTCQDFPAACEDDWSCECVVPTVSGCSAAGDTCAATPSHHVKLTCQGT
mgnify:CR=1 FL=1